jgi:hypothetical protein
MPFRTQTAGQPLFREPLKSEKVQARDVKPGDTLIAYNLHRVPVYRVVKESKPYPHPLRRTENGTTTEHAQWSVVFDRARDVPGPGERYSATISSDGLTAGPDYMWERVTELPDGFVMTCASRFVELDWVEGISRDEHHVFWQAAKHLDSKDNVLVRFALDDDFTRLPNLGQDIYLVRPHRPY